MITVSIAGVDKSTFIDWQGFSIDQRVTSQVDTATFRIKKYGTKNYAPSIGDEVIVSDGGTEVFGGSVVRVDQALDAAGLSYLDVTAVSHERTLDRFLVSREIQDRNAAYIINTIIDDYVNRYKKQIADMEPSETWATDDGTVAMNTTNGEFVYGTRSVKLTAVAGGTATGRYEFGGAMDLTKFDDGTASVASDLITFWYHVDAPTRFASVRICLCSDAGASYANYYLATISAAPRQGWNQGVIPKSAFVATGSPSFSSIRKVQARVTASASGTVNVSVDDIRMVQAATAFTQKNVVDAGAPFLGSVKFNYEQVSQAIKAVAEAVGNDWYVDPDRDIHFYQGATEPAPFSLTDTSQNFDWRSLKISSDSSTIKNQVYVRGGEYEGNASDFDVEADGIALNYRSPYRLKNVTVSVAAVSKTVGVDNIDDPASFDCLYNFQEKTLKFKSATKPSAGQTVRMHGNPMIPVIIKKSDATSIAAHGVYEFAIIDKSITTQQGGRDRASAEIQNYRDSLTEGGFRTTTPGLRAGQMIAINVSALGVNETYIINSVKFSARSPTDFAYDVQLVSTRSFGIIEYLLGLLRSERKQIIINDNEVVDLVQDITEQVAAGDAWTQATTNAQTDTVTPSDSETHQLDHGTVFVYAPYNHASFSDTKRAFILDGSPLGSSATFLPSDLSGLQMWLETDYGVTNDGSGKCSQILDRSANGYVITQTTSAKRPAIDTSHVDAPFDILDFDGTNDCMSHPSFHLTGAQTWFIVWKNDVNAAVDHPLVGSKGSTLTIINQINYAGYGPYTFEIDYTTGTTVGVFESSPTTPQKLTITYAGSSPSTAGSYAARKNGTAKTVSSGAVTDTGAGWATGFFIGTRPSELYFLNGKIFAILAYNRVLNSTEIANVESYLSRWGV